MNEHPQDSFVFYRSFREAIAVMTPEDQLATFLAICDYALYGAEPKLSGMPLAVFIMAKPSIDANASKREGGKKGGRPKKETTGFENENHRFPKAENNEDEDGDEAENETGNGNGEKVPPVGGKRSPRFSPPSVEEVRAYCRERGNCVDPERFVDFYASKGWKVGKNPMADWKACVRTWERRDRDNGNGGGTPFEYDPGDMTGSL